MKVICKSNNFIAIPTKKKSECLYMLGQYLNKETCEVKLDKDGVDSISCKMKPEDNSWHYSIELFTELPYDANYIILDTNGNLVNVVSQKQFEEQYAILQDDDNK